MPEPGVADFDEHAIVLDPRRPPTASRPCGIASRAFRNRFRNTCCSLYSTPVTTGAGDSSSRRTLILLVLELVLEQAEHVVDDRVQIDVGAIGAPFRSPDARG